MAQSALGQAQGAVKRRTEPRSTYAGSRSGVESGPAQAGIMALARKMRTAHGSGVWSRLRIVPTHMIESGRATSPNERSTAQVIYGC
jgi:hypothetical protein